MRVTFWHSDKPRERLLADAWRDGVLANGDQADLRPLLPEVEVADCDVAVMVGVKSRALYQAHWHAGQHIVYMDKGYSRHAAPGPVKLWEYWRVAVDAHHPTAHLMDLKCPPDRWSALGLELKPWQWKGSRVLLAGSSQKYHDFYGMKDPTRWAQKVVGEIRRIDPNVAIVYRPKPSWKEAVPLEGTIFSGGDETIDQALADCRCVVTHGSNAVFEGMLAGIPSVVLGEAVTKPLSSTSLEDISEPRMVSMPERIQWAQNLAYFQWTMPEIAAGHCWRWLRPMIYGRPRGA